MLTKTQEDRIIADYLSGLTIRATATKNETHYTCVRNVLENRGVSRRPRRKYTMDQTFFERVDSHEKAQILGFYWADGCLLDKTPSQPYQERLALVIHEKDRDYLEWIKQQFKATYPLYEIFRKSDGGRYVRLVVSDQKPIADLRGLGLHPRKSLIIGFPTLEQVPAEFVPSFVLGAFEGDGCVHLLKSGHGASVQFAATINFNETLQRILADLGIHSTIHVPKKSAGKNFCRLAVTRKQDIDKLATWMYGGTSFKMLRKWQLFQDFRARYDANWRRIKTGASATLVSKIYRQPPISSEQVPIPV